MRFFITLLGEAPLCPSACYQVGKLAQVKQQYVPAPVSASIVKLQILISAQLLHQQVELSFT